MKAVSNFIIILVTALLIHLREGHGAADFVDPPTGTLIVNFKGTLENAVTITCNITHIIQNVVTQISTQWSIENFRNSANLVSLPNDNIPEITIDGDLRLSGSTFRNRLTISALTSQLDGVTIHCGTGEEPRQASYPVQIYPTPSEPRNLAVDTIEATYMVVCWDAPFNSTVSYYLINATNLNDTGMDLVTNTSTNGTFFNVTGLLPGTTYELTVVAVSQGGEIVAKSQVSEPETRTTGLTVPALVCNNPEFMEGGITARWSYIHTGGQDLTSVLVSYTLEEGGRDSTPMSVMNTDPTITSINVPRLTAGTRYSFNITAMNSIGSSHILCGPTLLSIGIPLAPSIGNLFAGSIATEIKLEIKTLASGEGSGFRFNIIPVRNGMEEPRQMFMNDTYQSSVFVTLTVGDLTEGGTYMFSATAENNYGESGSFNSRPVVIGDLQLWPPPTQEQQGSSNVGAIIGGVVGVLLPVIVIVIAIVAISLHLRYNKGHSKHASNVKIEVPIYDEPDNFQRNTSNASDIELKDCPAYEKVQKETHIELEQCPAYGELQSRC